MAAKIDVEIFNNKGEFLLWHKKMNDVLIKIKVAKAVEPSFVVVASYDKKVEIDDIALKYNILSL